MTQIKDFILTLLSATAVTAIFNGIVPDGALKKYLKYLLALFILVVLISPLKGIILGIGDITDFEAIYSNGALPERSNHVIALHVKEAVAEKFSIDDDEIKVKSDGEKIILTVKKRRGLLAEDISYYAARGFGVRTEVVFYE